jgi:DNA-binding transcriptional MerR regulator
MGGLVAVPVAGLLLVRHRPGLHSPQSTPSSTLEGKMSDRLLTISEQAGRAGVPTSALHYWEELGLLPTAARISGQRRYPESAVGFVGIILLLRDVGFSLAEQKAFMAARAGALDGWQRLARGEARRARRPDRQSSDRPRGHHSRAALPVRGHPPMPQLRRRHRRPPFRSTAPRSPRTPSLVFKCATSAEGEVPRLGFPSYRGDIALRK